MRDGMGLDTNGCGAAGHPDIFLGIYTRPLSSSLPYGEAQMLLTDASDESCTGFASGPWYTFTRDETASDGDGLVYPAPRTLTAFDYWDGYPGVGFLKMADHPGYGQNLDPYETTLGDNYTLDTISTASTYPGHVDAGLEYNGQTYTGPWTFAWASGYDMTVTADTATTYGGRYFLFSSWSSGDTTPAEIFTTGFCDVTGQYCPTVYNVAFYGMGCLANLPAVTGDQAAKSGTSAVLTWPAVGSPGDVQSYAVFSATDPTSAANFSLLGTTDSTTFTDSSSSGAPVSYYVIAATCGPYSGPWGHYGQ